MQRNQSQRVLPRSAADAETILVVEDDDDVRAYSNGDPARTGLLDP